MGNTVVYGYVDMLCVESGEVTFVEPILALIPAHMEFKQSAMSSTGTAGKSA